MRLISFATVALLSLASSAAAMSGDSMHKQMRAAALVCPTGEKQIAIYIGADKKTANLCIESTFPLSSVKPVQLAAATKKPAPEFVGTKSTHLTSTVSRRTPAPEFIATTHVSGVKAMSPSSKASKALETAKL